MRIGELSHATGASTRALRYYEEQGLIRSERLPNGYRDYGPEAIEKVEFIQDLLAAGLSSQILRDIMPCVTADGGQTPCADVLRRAQRVRDDLLEQERRIRARRETLELYLAGQRSPRGNHSHPRP
ncbi:MerR family transcriptional regulator [Micromonospora carbonacea]|uniref:DNA-binding transcriptional regulator, MerR family n=1 Tax=Micromonospora carbonacea TaxID=47853 RepID=A0A1C4YTG1_9ACTN|nr:MerR family transcriptional regulator [Micromonospora carbonacea]SCF23937.1 DNA-binding transcriptional regulator, MerR family [Micromonospora carbonacea]